MRTFVLARRGSEVRGIPRRLALLVGLFVALLVGVKITPNAWGANMTPIAVTGFNRDLVVESKSSGPPYTSALEFNPGEGTAYYQSGLSGKVHGLPASGTFASQLQDGTSFQFQSYSAANALVLSVETGLTTGTLTLTRPLVYNRIAILANSAGGGGAANLVIQFTDGTTYTTTYSALNWFNTAGYIALEATERMVLATGVVSGAPSNPRFFQTSLPLNTLLPNNKPIVSLTFSRATGASATAIYAVSGEVLNQIPAAFSVPPTNKTVAEAGTTSFTATVAGLPVPALQWYTNGLPAAGATNNSFVISNAPSAANGLKLYLTATNLANGLAYNVTSGVATLTVVPDLTPPRLVAAQSLGLSNVLAVFSKPITAATATNVANYQISGLFGNLPAVYSAVPDSTRTNLLLSVAPLQDGAQYQLRLNGLRDTSANANQIATNTITNFIAHTYAPFDLGGPPVPGGNLPLSNGWQVAGSGDLGGTSDQFQFSAQLLTGDFDVCARLGGMTDVDSWAKAGLMARESLLANSQFAATIATPSMNGDFFAWRAPTGGSMATAGSFPANYPNTWLRLQRAGNVFAGFAGYDGVAWSPLGSVTIAMAPTVYLGLAVGSRSTNAATLVSFLNVTAVGSNAVIGVPANPHAVAGPTSRKTPLAVSEIMYNPVPRPDGLNLQFVELYNSNPWFHDLSHYRLTGKGMNYVFPAGTTLSGGGYLVVAAAPPDLRAVYGLTNLFGPWTGTLKTTDNLVLQDEQGAVLLTVPYTGAPPWPVAPNGAGHSLVLADPTFGEADPRAWDVSDIVGGSPGQMEAYRPNPLRNMVVNEVLAHSENPAVAQYVELYNHGPVTNDLSGCVLTDNPATNRFVIPAGTLVPPGGFVAFTAAATGLPLNGAGGTVYFCLPDRTRVLDAVTYEAQEDGVAVGRWPDGAAAWYPLTAPTPGTNNAALLIRDVVINELMYKPISGNDDDQYIELYNAGAKAVDLGAWQFTSGVAFTFPSNTVLAAGGYLVVARNLTNLWAKYPNLNSANSLGNYSGRLAHGGERLALARPGSLTVTSNGAPVATTIYVVVDEVTWGTGGRWGQWSAGGGSSLELIDPRANHRLAANWGDSDESRKSAWTNISLTGVLDNGANYDSSIGYAQVGLLDSGECLVDNLAVYAGSGGPNLVSNPDFESGGLTNWTCSGSHVRSSLENEGYASARSLHIRCTDRLWTGLNSCQVSLAPNGLVAGQTATLSFQARWLHGWPEALFRLNGNWLEAAGALPIPANLGTPGMPNSIAVPNAGPAIYEVTHNPPVPAANQPVVVTARVHDPNGVSSLVLNYRLDPAPNYVSLPMVDDGTGGDALAGDGVYSATIPGQLAANLAAFYVSATDLLGGATRFPARANNFAPVPECVVLFGDGNPAGSFGVYHLWLTQTNVARWSTLGDLSNECMDCTMVNGNRVIYNASARFAGSPYHQNFDSPAGNLCHYKWIFPADDKFLGATDFNKIHQPGNSPGDDASLQREQIANSLLRALGVPWLNRRYVAVYVNGNRRGNLMEDAQCPNGDMLDQWFPNDTGGFLYKIAGWIEFAPFAAGYGINFANQSWCDVLPYTTTGGLKKPARYRYNWQIRHTPDSAGNFTNVFSVVDAANSFGTANYVPAMENLINMENWLRVFAANHAAGNNDSFGALNGQNMYAYVGAAGTKFSMMMWDYNMVFGSAYGWSPGENLFLVNPQDPVTAEIFQQPEFRRMYWRALAELVNGPFTTANTGPLAVARYNAFLANGLVNIENPVSGILGWMSAAHDSIASQLQAEDATAFNVNLPPAVTNDVATLTGLAPVLVKTVLINGVQYPLVWTTTTNWSVSVPLAPGINSFRVVGVDIHGAPVPGAGNSVSLAYPGAPVSPVGQVVINELMYAPAVPGGQYLELFNNSPTNTFDLTGWQIPAVGYTFPPGSLLGPAAYLVLAENGVAFADAYGATNVVFDTFSTPLAPTPELLTLLGPATNGSPGAMVARVQYDTAAPWPPAGPLSGQVLALVDPQLDNWRAGNWTNANPSPGAPGPALANLPAFPPLWINELQADNFTGPTNGFGQRVPWLELFNPGTNPVSLAGLFLAPNYANLSQWAFPTGAVIAPGQFLVVWADGQTNLSSPAELHTSFTLPSGSGSLALSRPWAGGAQVLDYVNYTNLGPNHSYGSVPDGQSFARRELYSVTPGAANNPAPAPLTVAINEWMAANSHTLGNPANKNKPDDWFELYNYGAVPANLAGFYLTDNPANPLLFQIPAGYVIPPGGYLLVWADKLSPAGSPTLHVNFHLAKAGGGIGLYRSDGTVVDFVAFGPQGSDISQGRFPDGGPNLNFMFTPTPGARNQLPNTPPTLAAVPPLVLAAGQSLYLPISATDTDQPPQQLTYTLAAGAPAGAGIDPVNGMLTWIAPNGLGTSTVTVIVTDNGIPNLSAAQTVSLQVVPAPQLRFLVAANGAMQFSWATYPGQNFQMQYTGDLAGGNWAPLGTPLAAAPGATSLTVTGSAIGNEGPMFYRLVLLPPNPN